MKIRSLLLGSAAAAGLATGAFAADPLELTSLNVCDSLGKSGLAISSDGNCLQISGEIKYEFNWGDYKGPSAAAAGVIPTAAVPVTSSTDTVIASTEAGNRTIATPGSQAGNAALNLDWASKLEWYIKFVATADTANGPASAVLKIKEVQQWVTNNEAYIPGKDNPWGFDTSGSPAGVDDVPGTGGDHTFGLIADEAYVSIGDATVVMIGKKGSIWNKTDDEPFNFLGLFNSDAVDVGVNYKAATPDGGHVLQVTSDLGNGIFASAGLENLQGTGATAGTAIGVLEYKGDGITAHITGVAGGVLDGVVENFAVHAGFTAAFDPIRVRAAIAADNTGYWNVLGTAEATFDIFKLAASGEATSTGDYGVGGSLTATVVDGVTLNVGGKYYNDAGAGVDGYQVAAKLSAAVTETLTLSGEVGVITNIFYGAAELAYAPGGGLTASVKAEAYSNGAYKGTVKAGKVFN
jgi:hypothetical protein